MVRSLIVIGNGIAGLFAALTARPAWRRRQLFVVRPGGTRRVSVARAGSEMAA